LVQAFVERMAKTDEPIGSELERRLLQARIEAREGFEWHTELGRAGRLAMDRLDRYDDPTLQVAMEDETRFELGFQDRISGLLSESQRKVWAGQVTCHQDARMQEFRIAAKLFRGSIG